MPLLLRNITRTRWVDPRSKTVINPGQLSPDLEPEQPIYDLRGFEAGIIADQLEVVQDDSGIFTHLTKLPVL